ncbi:MAG: hypothetical protein KF744_17420 [Taibaiella sp.]|nr:hypothetical protein [Taibaiella sp.]
MKRLLTLVFVLGLSVAACKKKQEDILSTIKETRDKINSKLKDYSIRKVDDIVLKGNGVVTGYYRDDEVRKVITEEYEDERRTFTEYYFDGGELIYVVSQDYVYNKPMSYTEEVARFQGDSVWYDDSKTKLEVNKYYLDDNKLIKWTGPNDGDVPVNIAGFTQKEPLLLAHALMALKKLKTE